MNTPADLSASPSLVSLHKIAQGCVVTLHFSLALEDGSIIDSNFEGSPATFTMGDGSMLPGFEDVLVGLGVNERASFRIEPEYGFGQHNPVNVQLMKRQHFPVDMELGHGLVVSFTDAAKSELPGVITAIAGDEISVDFNHPLAGKSIVFDVQVLGIEVADIATAEEAG
ncbi:MAG: peptidylprolyl isomerase [Gammaproteobacteria bacterium]|nr:MAG: peptidylprolyl isomerase [Gammaproteobacteria bacterium]RLA46779.1 MAG: peptidylprolyl isomerase [Gammaproteobacteria bacterium]